MKYLFLILIGFYFSFSISFASESCDAKWATILSHTSIPSKYNKLIGFCDKSFKKKLWYLIKDNKDLGYTGARKFMFALLDNDGGRVCSVYSNLCIETEGIPNASIMNCEHSWPQSLGATGKAKSDLHHLFPVESKFNSKRSNKPFCEVYNVTWEKDGSRYGFSKYDTECFEPPQRHKGDLARAMFYFSLRYSKPLDIEQEEFLRKWNKEDCVSTKEFNRNNDIELQQNNRNPFVDVPEFADVISDF